MKKLFFSISIVASILVFSALQTVADKAAATAEQEEGMYIFIKSKPVNETVYLGSVAVGLKITGNPLSSLIKEARKKYPDAEALITQETDLQKAKVQVVKFK